MNRAVGWLLVLLIGVPLLLLGLLGSLLSRLLSAPTTKPQRRRVVRMSDPFDGHPPQGVVYECRKEGCDLHDEQEVTQFSQVERQVTYYTEQGHQAIARFPAADDAEWPPDEDAQQE